jgi:hypothetical protein
MNLRRLVPCFFIVCFIAAVSVPAAYAESEYFFKSAATPPLTVSGVPRSTLYYVGAGYSGAGSDEYCIADYTTSNEIKLEECVIGVHSLSESFATLPGRGWLQMAKGPTASWYGEERW